MEKYKQLAKELLADFTKAQRVRLGLTQDKMAERLHITPRAYRDLERGKYCISTTVLLFLLLMLKDGEESGSPREMGDILSRFGKRVDALENQ